jgi:hypothetical protein
MGVALAADRVRSLDAAQVTAENQYLSAVNVHQVAAAGGSLLVGRIRDVATPGG